MALGTANSFDSISQVEGRGPGAFSSTSHGAQREGAELRKQKPAGREERTLSQGLGQNLSGFFSPFAAAKMAASALA